MVPSLRLKNLTTVAEGSVSSRASAMLPTKALAFSMWMTDGVCTSSGSRQSGIKRGRPSGPMSEISE